MRNELPGLNMLWNFNIWRVILGGTFLHANIIFSITANIDEERGYFGAKQCLEIKVEIFRTSC